MKKGFLWFLFVAFFSVVFLCTPVLAVPTLQLDIMDDEGVHYDSTSETIVANSTDFFLYALLSTKDTAYLEAEFWISAALVPIVPEPSLNDVGSFVFGGSDIVIDLNSVGPGTPDGLPTHGIFPAYYWEFEVNFDENNTVAEYDTQSDPGGFGMVGNEKKTLYWASFDVNTASLNPDYIIHFDLYQTGSGVQEFAPFSHDAGSPPVPEPATMLLLGSGLIGLAVVGRRKFFKKS